MKWICLSFNCHVLHGNLRINSKAEFTAMIIDYTAYEGARSKTEISFSAIGCGKTFFVMNRVCQALAHNYKQSAIDFILNEYNKTQTGKTTGKLAQCRITPQKYKLNYCHIAIE